MYLKSRFKFWLRAWSDTYKSVYPVTLKLYATKNIFLRKRATYRISGIQFNQRGHSVSDVRIIILEKTKTSDESYPKERERYLSGYP